MDRMTQEQRHRCMASIKGRDTRPELLVRRYLFACGFRFRVNVRNLPGRPDVVLARFRTVIFVNGCFWHGHAGCRYFVMPKSNTEFWQQKIDRNRQRDQRVIAALRLRGWHCLTVWECQLKPAERERTLQSLVYTLCHLYVGDHSCRKETEIPVYALPQVAEEAALYGKNTLS